MFTHRALLALATLLFFTSLAAAGTDATLLRLFLTDGSALVSYGEYARLDDRVIFSMPIGGSASDPRLSVVSVPAGKVDWVRTDAYSASARHDWYANTRGEDDFQRMSSDVARVLNQVALGTDRRQALAIAESARRTLAGWPVDHFGYRQADVREILSLVDEAISALRASMGISKFELNLVAADDEPAYAPLLGMPSSSEQLDQVLRVAALTDRAHERVALLNAALSLIADPAASIPRAVADPLRASLRRQIRDEADLDDRYASMTRRLMSTATRAAEGARIADVEKVLAQIPREDERLGRRRPDDVQALRAAVQVRLDDARRLRLLKDRWLLRRALYRDWQRSVGVQLLRLVKERATLEAIRGLEGPAPSILATAHGRLAGGADRLQRIGVNAPDDLRSPNDLLVSAWRFAETAVSSRARAASTGDVATAWEASSAAAAALLMLDRAQEEVRSLLEPPTLR